VRFDLRFPETTPLGSPPELWFDHAIVQETAPTYSGEVLKFLDNLDHEPKNSMAFKKMERKKTRKYAPIIAVATRLAEERKLGFQPLFLFPVLSALGFCNDSLVDVVKFMSDLMKNRLQSEPPRLDGLNDNVLRARWKMTTKNSMCFALAKGNALALFNQGSRGVSKPP